MTEAKAILISVTNCGFRPLSLMCDPQELTVQRKSFVNSLKILRFARNDGASLHEFSLTQIVGCRKVVRY